MTVAELKSVPASPSPSQTTPESATASDKQNQSTKPAGQNEFISAQELIEIKPRITVIGVGGAGGNAVNNMIRSKLQGVQFVVCNTDAQSLAYSLCERRIQLGSEVTQGLGAGSKPEVGRAAAEESLDQLLREVDNSNMVFITAGMGGGTGTGAAPVIAQAARERGILTVAVVTKPFHFEGNYRMKTAESGIEELSRYVDTLIIIPNQNLFRLATEKTTFADAFKMADDVLHSGVRGVTDLMMMPGLINLDFADIRAIMSEMGKAMMGTGEATGDSRAISAAQAAISNPLLDDVSMKGARGVLINITGGHDMRLFEVDEAANHIREEVDPDANIIFGSTFDEKISGIIRVSVVATGIDAADVDRVRTAQAQEETQTSLEDAISEKQPEEDPVQEPESSDVPRHLPPVYEEDTHGQRLFTERYKENNQDYEWNSPLPPQKPQEKKGFFGRLADTMRGTSRDDKPAKNMPQQQRTSHPIRSKDIRIAEQKETNTLSAPDIHEIPAYLRRKSNQ